MSGLRPATIHLLQEEGFSCFLHETNRRNGLVRDKTRRVLATLRFFWRALTQQRYAIRNRAPSSS